MRLLKLLVQEHFQGRKSDHTEVLTENKNSFTNGKYSLYNIKFLKQPTLQL